MAPSFCNWEASWLILISISYLGLYFFLVKCILTVFWSAKTLTNFITARLRAQHISFDEQKLLLFFPSLLTYVLFALLSVY